MRYALFHHLMKKLRSHIFLCTIVCALLIACTSPPKPAGPTFSGRLFFLSGGGEKGADLDELQLGPAGSKNSYQVVTSGIFDTAVSPDQTKLLYRTADGLVLRDFTTGAVKSLVKGQGYCLAWAPDGNHFTYLQGNDTSRVKVFTSDIEGKSKLILDYPNAAKPCPQWISADRLVFDRFVGATTEKTQLKPNTTTVATIGDSVKTRDTPRKWIIEGVCAKSNNALMRSADQGKLLIGKNIDHFETIDPSPAPDQCSSCQFIGYAAQSCVPFFIEQSTSATTDVFYLNPTNWQKQRPSTVNRTFTGPTQALIKSSAKLMVVGDGPNLFLVDTESGAIVSLLGDPAEQAAASGAPKVPVVWIEK
jgi:hypothetical protein